MEPGIPMWILDAVREQHPKVRAFVETGTYLGETVEKALHRFDRIASVELSHELHERAAKLYGAHKHVRLYQGTSRTVLGDMLRDMGAQPALIWLDAHYSCGNTAREAPGVSCPIEGELACISAHAAATGVKHIIAVDDTEDFQGQLGFPMLHRLAHSIATIYPGHVIRLYPTMRRGVLLAAENWR